MSREAKQVENHDQSNDKMSPSKLAAAKAFPVYSDFSHMSAKQGLGNIAFAVGLRDDSGQDLLQRVFPMTKIIPVVKAEKKKKPKKKEKVVEEKICSRIDCSARRDKYTELQKENDVLRNKLKLLEGKVETTKNKITLTEKSIIMAEEKNDTLNGQIEDAQTRIFAIEADVEKGENFNQTLRKQLATVQQEIDDIKRQTEEQSNQLKDIIDNKSDRHIVFSRDPRHRDERLATEVSTLRFQNEDEDSD